ncbi:asparagine synthetase B family protein [Lihuaxuella thermophila]|uniref:asparagine synthase (glutamine-hydrolyzing) n=1 Tax=Lihuaxuella thermophila TaxID=1173111 RepID=A0A1H8G5D2_9BACL|nr:asparagine synthase-related protein [Lihuaxuella thermophila]SEN39223.1 asparagine synthase (glutamine-hydrolysing) [Lihuaxuella thermophila]
MSAICGFYDTEKRKDYRLKLPEMLKILQFWGPDWQSCWNEDHVGLGQATLVTVPEAKREMNSVFQTNHLRMVADCRIDNREELLPQLGITAGQDLFSDEEILLYSYLKWGETCVSRIVGDFAFALWDEKRKELFCARDPLGMRPLYYKWDGSVFVFASQIRAIHPTLTSDWNMDYFVDYLYLRGNSTDHSTPFQGVYRLPRGSYVKVSEKEFTVKSYWSLENTKSVEYRNDRDYDEHFRDIFFKAVRSRLRSIGPVSVIMSGGLDSTSIFSVAKCSAPDKDIFPVSAVFDRYKESDERDYIQMVLDQYKINDNEFVISDDLYMLKDYPEYSPSTDEPSLPQLSYALNYQLYQRAAKRKAKVALQGYAGDEIFGFHRNYISDYLRKLRLFRFMREAGQLAKCYNETMLNAVIDYGLKPLLFEEKEHPVLLPKYFNEAKQRFVEGYSIYDPVRRAQYEYINRARNFSFVQHYVSEALGMETRYPFLDQRLVEFMYNVPLEQKIKEAQTKVLLRRALKGILPDGIASRQTKTSHDHLLFDGLKHEWNHLYPILRKPVLEEMGLIYQGRLLNQITLYRHGQLSNGMQFYAALSLELWLRKYVKSEVA